MFWVGVRYRKIPLPDIMKTMRVWLDSRGYRLQHFDYVISGTGVLVRVQFEQEAQAIQFAEAFAGSVSRDCPSIERDEPAELNQSAADGCAVKRCPAAFTRTVTQPTSSREGL